MLKKIHIWFLKRELSEHLKSLETYVSGSSFDMGLSTYDYRRRLTQLRERVRATAERLDEYGVDVSNHKDYLKWR